MRKNLNSCDGGHLTINPVKVLPISKAGGNLIVCYQCFLKEMKARIKGAKINGKDKYDFPKWDELKEYKAE
jgi:hypothetical protein